MEPNPKIVQFTKNRTALRDSGLGPMKLGLDDQAASAAIARVSAAVWDAIGER